MGKEKQLIHKTKKCGGTYEVCHLNGTIPFLKCDKCEHEIKDWIKWEEEYKDYWTSDERWKEKKNHITCLLGFFAEHFRNYYDFEYSWSLNEKGLFRGPEANILRRIYTSFNSDAYMVRKYIDWHFETKVRKRKKRITSLSFLAVPDAMNEYKIFYKKSRLITRDKLLPQGMLRWIHDHASGIEQFNMHDYGDLNQMLRIYKASQQNSEHSDKFVEELKRQNVVLEDLQIRNWRENA